MRCYTIVKSAGPACEGTRKRQSVASLCPVNPAETLLIGNGQLFISLFA
jgi:hypothetical protein